MHRHRRLLLVILLLLALLALAEWSGLRQQFSLAWLQATLRQHQYAGPLTFMLLFALGNLLQIPGWLFLAAAVITLGKTTGGLVTYAAACCSCTITFIAIRQLGGNALRQLDSRLAMAILQQIDHHPITSVALLRLFFQTLPQVNYALAMTGIRLRHYLLGTLLGLPLPLFLYCLFFDTLAKAAHII